jgi:cytochrome c
MRTSLSLICALMAIGCTSVPAEALFQDEFNGSIDPAWTIAHPDQDFYKIRATELDLRCGSPDIDCGPVNNAKNLFTIANPACGDNDLMITLSFNSFVPAKNDHAQVCIVAMDDEDNFVRANYGFIMGGRAAEFGKEVGANWVPQQTRLDLGSGAFWLRLTKNGAVYTQSYSTDGITYTQINAPISFGDGSPARLGFVSGVDPSESSHAYIDSFTVEVPTAAR